MCPERREHRERPEKSPTAHTALTLRDGGLGATTAG